MASRPVHDRLQTPETSAAVLLLLRGSVMGKKAKRNDGANQALIICLVFSVLLNIGMAVATFAGFSEQSTLDGKIKEARTSEDSAKKARNWEQYLHLTYKAAMGYQLSKDEEDAFSRLQKEFAAGALGKGESNKEDEDKNVKKIQDDGEFDANKNQFKAPILGKLRTAVELMKGEQKKSAEMKLTIDKSVTDSNRRNKNIEEEINKLRDLLKEKEKNIIGAKEDKSKEFGELKDAVEKWLKEKEVMIDKANAKEAEDKATIDKLKKQIADLQERYQKTIVRIAPIDMTVHSDPHGKILRIDRSGGLVYIDLGFSDNVKPQLTFSVFPAGSRKAKGDPKAAVEVVNVLAAHLSACRVIEVADIKDPIIVNDALFNVVWSPSLKQHISVAGLIDLTGDGTDNTEEFMRTLERQNIVIDSFMDTKDREYTVKGEMSFKTNYLVLGEVPKIDGQLAETDPRLENAKKVLTRLSEMQNEAGRLGVTIVPARRFMSLVGFKTPKSIRPAEYAVRPGLDVKPAGGGDKPAAEKGEGDEKPKAKKDKDKEAMDGDEKPKAKKDKDKEAMDGDEKPKAKKDKAKEAMEKEKEKDKDKDDK
jgi:hypothetical protein